MIEMDRQLLIDAIIGSEPVGAATVAALQARKLGAHADDHAGTFFDPAAVAALSYDQLEDLYLMLRGQAGPGRF